MTGGPIPTIRIIASWGSGSQLIRDTGGAHDYAESHVRVDVHDRNAFQGRSVRYVDGLDYHRILDAAGLTGAAWHAAPTVDDVVSGLLFPAALWSLRAIRSDRLRWFRTAQATGRPGRRSTSSRSRRCKSELRGDHQDTLKLVKAMVERATVAVSSTITSICWRRSMSSDCSSRRRASTFPVRRRRSHAVRDGPTLRLWLFNGTVPPAIDELSLQLA